MAEKYTEQYWSGEITRAEQQQEDRKFIEKAEKSVKLFEAEKCLESGSRKLNAWWMVTTTLLPAYYSQKPKVESTLRKKRGGPAAALAARVAEGAAQYSIDTHFLFDQVANRAVLQYLLTGRSSLWARYEADIRPKTVEAAEIEEDGIRETVIEAEEVADERVVLEVPHYRDYLVSCGRDESEIEWRGRRAYLRRDQAEAMFGSGTANKLKFDVLPDEIARRGDGNKYEKKAELWEIWCEVSGKVYWISKRGEKSILEAGEPPLKYEGFYPCVDIVQNLSLDSVIPVSDYAELEDQLLEIERLTTRIHAVTKAIRVNIAADDTIAEKLKEIFSGDLDVIAVPTTAKRLAEAMEFTPIEPYVRALEVLVQQRELALGKVYEATGAADIVRGMTNPAETATAQEIKAQFFNARFSLRQRQVHEFFGKAISKLGEAICSQFDPMKLIEMANLEDEVMKMPPELVNQALALLKDSDDRCYSLEIATDSMVAMDEKQDRQQRVDLLASAGGFLQQLEPLMTNYPAVGQLGMELMKFTIRSYRGGKELEQTFEAILGTMLQQMQQKAQQQQPDPGAAQAQARMQEAQINAQLKQQQMMLDSQKMQVDIELRRDELLLKQSEIQLEAAKLQLEQMRLEAELGIKAKEIDSKDAQAVLKAEIDQRMQAVTAQMEAIKIDNDKQRVALEMYEKLLEEKRLAIEAAAKTTPPITVHVDGGKGGKRIGKIIRDAQGNATGMEMQEA